MTAEPACTKVRYYTRREARRSGRVFLGSHKGRLRAYRCPGCGFWHLTSESTAKVTRYRAYGRRAAPLKDTTMDGER